MLVAGPFWAMSSFGVEEWAAAEPHRKLSTIRYQRDEYAGNKVRL